MAKPGINDALKSGGRLGFFAGPAAARVGSVNQTARKRDARPQARAKKRRASRRPVSRRPENGAPHLRLRRRLSGAEDRRRTKWRNRIRLRIPYPKPCSRSRTLSTSAWSRIRRLDEAQKSAETAPDARAATEAKARWGGESRGGRQGRTGRQGPDCHGRQIRARAAGRQTAAGRPVPAPAQAFDGQAGHAAAGDRGAEGARLG